MEEKRLRHVIRKLAEKGHKIAYNDDNVGGEIVGPSEPVTVHEINFLGAAGWINNLPNGSGCVLSDTGRKAFMRSTDELGDGELRIDA